MPDDVPPRPGAPGYEEFIAHKQPAPDAAASGPAAGKPAAPAASSVNRPPNEEDVRGGLY